MTTLPTTHRDSSPAPLQMTIREAAHLLAYDVRTITRLITRGEIQAVGHGRLRRIPLSSLHDYQQRNLTASVREISHEPINTAGL